MRGACYANWKLGHPAYNSASMDAHDYFGMFTRNFEMMSKALLILPTLLGVVMWFEGGLSNDLHLALSGEIRSSCF